MESKTGMGQTVSTSGQKLVFGNTGHSNMLLKLLHKQWREGKYCDLILSAGSSKLPVHSCIISCFSSKIGHHLHQAELAYACALSMEQTPYKVTEGGLSFSFLQTGEKMVEVDINTDIAEALMRFMYTGCLTVPRCQVMLLLEAAQLLDFTVIVKVLEVFVTRNLDAVNSVPPSSETLNFEDALQTESRISDIGCHSEQGAVAAADNGVPTDESMLHVPSYASSVQEEQSSARKNSTEKRLHLEPVDLDIKQEMADSDLQHILDAQVPGHKEAIPTKSCDKSPPAETAGSAERKRKRSAGKVKTDELDTVVIKQEILEDCPVHFQQTAVPPELNSGGASDSDTEAHSLPLPVSDHEVVGSTSLEAEANGIMNGSLKVGVSKTTRKTGPHLCSYCSRSYSKKTCLQDHIFKVHQHKKFRQNICPHCDLQFEKQEEVKAHCKEKHGDFVCEEQGCEFRSSLRRTMKTHQKRAHGMQHYSRSKCEHQTKRKQALTKQKITNHATFSCPLCSRSFFQKENLSRHLRTKHGQDSFQCQHCADCFIEESQLLLHWEKFHKDDMPALEGLGSELSLMAVDTPGSCQLIGEASAVEPLKTAGPSLDMLIAAAVHTEGGAASAPVVRRRRSRVRPSRWNCRLCSKKEHSSEALSLHLRTEHEAEVFSCQQCPMSFVRKNVLTKHIFAEHQGRRWTCPQCGEVFKIATRFADHCKTQHGILKPFHCQEPLCNYQSNSSRCLVTHQKYVHCKERNDVCHNCGSCFPSKLYLRNHQRNCLRLEQHLCPTCGAVFSLRQSLLSHINNKHGGERRYSCSLCGQRFSCHANRNRHMRIHNNSFPYMCDICGQKFRHSNSLKYHVQRKHQNP